MNYQEFRDLWHSALRTARLPIPYPAGPTERINLHDMSRSYELILRSGSQPKCDPFYPVTTINWEWDALLAARAATTEEDMLMQIFGDFDDHDDSLPSRLRIDVRLSAGVSYGTVYPMPAQAVWQRWVRRASDELETLLPTGFDNDGDLCAASDSLQATVKLLDDGRLGLEGVTFNAWQAIMIPRQWDHPEKSDPDPEEALVDFAVRISKAFTTFENHLTRLVGGKSK